MSIYLIDFENVHYDGLSGILNLHEGDEVYVFYSDNGKRLTFELHEQIIQSEAKFYYYKAAVGGKNALDHQLSTYLGFLVGKKEEKKYYIVSKDQGFRHLIAFWKSANLGLEINLVDSIRISRQNQNGGSAEQQATIAAEIKTQADAKPKAETDSPLAKLLASRRKSRPAKAKPAAEPTAASAEPAEKALPQRLAAPTPPEDGHSQAAATVDKPETSAAEPMTMSRGFTTDNKHAAADGKIPPKVIEFVLPQEVMAAGKPGRAALPETEQAAKPAAEIEAKTEDKAAAKPEAAQSADGANDVKAAKVQPARRGQAKKSEPAKKIKAEPTEPAKARPIYHEEDIVEHIPEAAGQPWLVDVARYLNNSGGKADLYNMIRRRLGQEEGRKVYNLLKKMI
ncbi:MAG: hypothetical protein GX572_06670 [Clostridia bacterium]|nr:hypothetical protein [Clostridia bacterium]